MKDNIIETTISKLYNNPDQLDSMGSNAEKLIIKNANQKIVEQIVQLLRNN